MAPLSERGRLAQWLEHAVHIRGVTGSNPVSPTSFLTGGPDSTPVCRDVHDAAAASENYLELEL